MTYSLAPSPTVHAARIMHHAYRINEVHDVACSEFTAVLRPEYHQQALPRVVSAGTVAELAHELRAAGPPHSLPRRDTAHRYHATASPGLNGDPS